VDHLVGHGVDLFQAVCQRDLEGIVAKAAQGLYQPEKTTWVKIKNPNYSQAAGRRDFSMHGFAENLRLDLEKLRSRLARMSDDKAVSALFPSRRYF
jgi:hypothetical protein